MPRIQKRIQPTGVRVHRALLAKCFIEKPMLGGARLDSLPIRGIRDPTAFQLSTSESPTVSGRQDASTITGASLLRSVSLVSLLCQCGFRGLAGLDGKPTPTFAEEPV